MNCIQQHNTHYFANLNKNFNCVCFNNIKTNTVLQQAVPKILTIISYVFHLYKLYILYIKVKVKVKDLRITGHKGPEGE